MPVVGIGGSAGALEAFKQFFAAVPMGLRAAFVVIQHLDPDRESLLHGLLAGYTRMEVLQAEEAVRVEAGRVYVIPPNAYLSIRQGLLHLAEPPRTHAPRMSIDLFLRSLAEDQQDRAICILFSGAGSDGTLGLRAVRGAGGMAMVQDPATAQYGDMPRNAIATGLVDYVLAPAQMGPALQEYLLHFHHRGVGRALPSAAAEPNAFEAILTLLLARTGRDFRSYKKSTVLRRIERRMGLGKIADLSSYLRFLGDRPEELQQLQKDMLIGVTGFFRDAEAFEELRSKVIAPLVQRKPARGAVRVWVAGCASGEEAFSIAMLLVEELDAAKKQCLVQVFATDIDEEAIKWGRAGVFPASAVTDISAERLSRFFEATDQEYRIKKELRDTVVFATQDVVSDPPFSRMDLICCRNLLIYLEPETQQRILSMFHFALDSGGYLFLGKSEGIGGQTGLFEVLNKRARIFRKLAALRPAAANLAISPLGPRTLPSVERAAPKAPLAGLADLVRQQLLEHFGASLVLIDRKGQVLQFFGPTRKYLDLPPAEPNLNLLELARKGLSSRLRSAVHQAFHDGRIVVLQNVQIPQNGEVCLVRVTVCPVKRREEAEIAAVFFEDMPPSSEGPDPRKKTDVQDESVIRQLEHELEATRHDLQGTVEELQTSNEELRAANEEVTSMNEELQSTNEELETSREELQSVNEELATVNSQLQEKVERLDQANEDMANLLEATDIATIFVGPDLNIRFFTPAATRLLNLIPGDIGRPIGHFSQNTDVDLLAEIRKVLMDARPVEKLAQSREGAWYVTRIMPYHKDNSRISGAVITFVDISRLRQAEEQEHRLAAVMMDSNDAIVMVGLDGKIQMWNQGAERMYGYGEAEALGMDGMKLVPPGKASEAEARFQSLVQGQEVHSYEVQRLTKDGRTLDVWVTASKVLDASGKVMAVAMTERDVTERNRTAAELRASNDLAVKRAEELQSLALEVTAVEQKERRRLSQSLHDNLQQMLVGAKFQLHGFQGKVQTDRKEAVEELERLLGECIEGARSLTFELNPPILQEAGLVAGLHWLARQMREKQGLTVEAEGDASAEPRNEDVQSFLFQAVRELLLNVVKHAKVNHARVSLSADKGGIRIQVRDEGAGFDGQKLLAGKSRGFGLFSIRQRIALMGGEVDIASQPGRGTCVTLVMPQMRSGKTKRDRQADLARSKGKASASPAAPPSRAGKGRSGGKIRVLLVDDHQVMRHGLAVLLKEEGDIEVIGEASDGESGVRLATELRPDVVLMDVSMPGMNGIEATRIIHESLPDMSVIGLSMYDEGDMTGRMQEAGAAGYVSKNAPSETLIAAIRGAAPHRP